MNGYHGESDDDSQSVGSLSSDLSGGGGSSADGDSQSDLMGRGGSGSRDDNKIARTESHFVLCSKFLAYLVLFLSAVAAGVAAFYFTRNQETSEFEDDVSLEKGRDCTRHYGTRTLSDTFCYYHYLHSSKSTPATLPERLSVPRSTRLKWPVRSAFP